MFKYIIKKKKKRSAALETRMLQAILRLCVRLGWCSVKLHCGTVLWEDFLVSCTTLNSQ